MYLFAESINTLKNFDTERTVVCGCKKYLEDHNIEYNEEDNCNELIDKYYDNIENINKKIIIHLIFILLLQLIQRKKL